MVNTCTDADLSAAVQNALQTLLPQIRTEIREQFRTSSGSSDAGGNPPLISHMEKIFNVMGCEDAFKTRLAMYKFEGNALAWWKAYKQAKGGDAWLITVTWANFKNCWYRGGAGKELSVRSLQVANAARNYEILHERDDDDAEQPDKRQKSGDRHQPTSQQSSHRNHDQTGDVVVTTTAAATTTTLAVATGIPIMGVTRETGVSSPTDLPILVLSSPGVPLRTIPSLHYLWT
nr:hypothetical protein [Tanacetum cinerariifolium]